jgi:hypothetical protein
MFVSRKRPQILLWIGLRLKNISIHHSPPFLLEGGVISCCSTQPLSHSHSLAIPFGANFSIQCHVEGGEFP